MNYHISELKRPQSRNEEFANSAAHGLGLLAALCGAPYLIAVALRSGDIRTIVGACIFSIAMILLYLMSTIYHALPASKGKQLFHLFDHIAIFLLIAGTYTPFTLGVLYGTWGWTLLGLIWGLTGAGVIVKTFYARRHQLLSTCFYIGMGWLVIIAIRPLWLHLPRAGLIWLFLGGISYTAGVAFYNASQVRYSHFIWHLFVLAGTACHFFAVLWYAA